MTRSPLRLKLASLALAAAGLSLPLSADAHRMWVVPSATALSADNAWVTFDAAVSNTLFHPDHVAFRGELLALGPDGKPVTIQNHHVGQYRTVFDLQLTQRGTYRVFADGRSAMAFFKVDGEGQRARAASVEELKKQIPANATEVRIMQMHNRVETYVTNGAPSNGVFAAQGEGLELVPVTHPNDLYAGDPATFGFALDGKPAAGLDVTVIPGARRYRDSEEEVKYTTDAKGQIQISWPAPGMYYLTTRSQSRLADGTPLSVSYTATFEVLPE